MTIFDMNNTTDRALKMEKLIEDCYAGKYKGILVVELNLVVKTTLNSY